MSKSTSSVSDNHTITTIQAARSIKQAMRAKRPVFLWGPPGIGKSDVVKQIAIELSGDRKSTRLNSSHSQQSRMPSSA